MTLLNWFILLAVILFIVILFIQIVYHYYLHIIVDM